MELLITDFKFFRAVLFTFNKQKTITFELTDKFTISAENQIFMLQPSSYTPQNIGSTTILTSKILAHIKQFNSPIKIIQTNILTLTSQLPNYTLRLKIDLLYNTQFNLCYKKVNYKFFLKKYYLLFDSSVIYELKGTKLALKSVQNVQVDYLYLNLEDNFENEVYEDEFACDNGWVDCLKEISWDVLGVYLSVGEYILVVQICFKIHDDSYLEIHVPKKIVP